MILLGTGTSTGVPSIGCGCAVCRSDNPKNKRTRCSVILGLPAGNLLIDTGPDVRAQLLREDIGLVHAVAYTHEHADHMMGLDDLRLMQFYLGDSVPLYCEPMVEQRIRSTFDYAFSDKPVTHAGVAKVAIRNNWAGTVRSFGHDRYSDTIAARAEFRSTRFSRGECCLLHRHE